MTHAVKQDNYLIPPIIPMVSYPVIRRNGELVEFNAKKISIAMTKAFLAVEGNATQPSKRIEDKVTLLTDQVVNWVNDQFGDAVHIETIQDFVEQALMQAGEHKVARAYVLYREQHAAIRTAHQQAPILQVSEANGQKTALDIKKLTQTVQQACYGLENVSAEKMVHEAFKTFYEGMPKAKLNEALIMTARMLIEKEPDYTYIAARLLLNQLREEVMKAHDLVGYFDYGHYFPAYIEKAVKLELLDNRLLAFDLERLAKTLIPARDLQFTYLGLQTLYDRYFQHQHGKRLEMPQAFFMRVAMGLAINEEDINARAIEFYHLLSSFDFMCSTPTLFNSGTPHPQLSSCFVSTIPDDLDGIFQGIKDNALMQKWAGGIGNDWTPVRGLGAWIKGTNGKSQGTIPFMKVANDTLVSCNQGGRRKGSGCAYLETWHIDIEEFLELRKNTGDDRRRTHDMNTANWIPDLFMQRMINGEKWSLFSPDEVPELHDLYGDAFNEKYTHYEQLGKSGQLRIYKEVDAVYLWRKMLTMLYETGHPWITFKDAFNIRNMQQHDGVIHGSNLCTEIGLNTKAYNNKERNEQEGEIAVCNLGSVNLAAHISDGKLDTQRLKRTVTTAMRILDNVIDINFYAVDKARRANLLHRPVGLGIMGFQDALYKLKIPYQSNKAVKFAEESMSLISLYAIENSSDLAKERGAYPSFPGSLWSQGKLPVDTVNDLLQSRGLSTIELGEDLEQQLNMLRNKVKSGMRHCNCLAIAPTATISNICGVSQSIEPTYENLYVKSNLSGNFTIVNPYLVADLKRLGLWDEVMINDLKFYNGSVQQIDRIPEEMKALYKTAFEIDQTALLKAAAARQYWLDQAQSLNLYAANPTGRDLDRLYQLAWQLGLKTTYYLRSKSATQVEKITLTSCIIDNAECEVCQ